MRVFLEGRGCASKLREQLARGFRTTTCAKCLRQDIPRNILRERFSQHPKLARAFCASHLREQLAQAILHGTLREHVAQGGCARTLREISCASGFCNVLSLREHLARSPCASKFLTLRYPTFRYLALFVRYRTNSFRAA